MICTEYNSHIYELLHKQDILWKCILSNGQIALSDFDLPDTKDPWTRLKIYCNNNGVDILEVKVMCPGMPEETIYKNDSGLDNFFITRGMCRDINDDNSITFKYMCFGKVEDDDKIHVKKFYWPQFALAEYEEIREMTPENEDLLYRKRKQCKDNCECQKK